MSDEAPTHEDLCILSRIFNDREIPVPHGTNFRINEWLKAQIAGTASKARAALEAEKEMAERRASAVSKETP